MPSSSTGQTAPATWTEPPWCGWIETTGDALLILEAARRGLIPRVTRRLVDSERKMIDSGSVFVFDEDESGIKRWTDGFFWSPSRILGNFLLYRETDKKTSGRGGRCNGGGGDSSDAGDEGNTLSRPRDGSQLGLERQRERNLMGSLTNNPKFKSDGLMKKTFSLTIGGVAQHLISYYRVEDVENGRLRSPSSLPELASLSISPEYLDKTHFRNPPKVETGPDGIPRYRGEADDVEIGLGISRSPKPPPPLTVGPPLLSEGVVRGASTSVTPTAHRYEPYVSARPRRQKSIIDEDTTPSPVTTTSTQAAAISPTSPILPDSAEISTAASTISSPPPNIHSSPQPSTSLYPESQPRTQTPPAYHYAYYAQGQGYSYPPIYAYHHPSAASAAPAQPTTSSVHSAASPSSPPSNSATSPASGTYPPNSSPAVPFPYDPNTAGGGIQQQQPVYYPYGYGYHSAWTTAPYSYPVQQSTSGSGTEKLSSEIDGAQATT
ncbi:hypothetical protein E1B28_013286 [Marasmius oreades]|uniref:Uncharacterized protein n=1 Tax=Marasmius oreades TaxID=181124 RepID=A0A9P7RPE7_9AGAR|nr:uncharacterized protein E1B28_013286 [Marasmius oreades]KAG7087309.1 hypothetical protein E1B28_013286 [Marasmius oreades]